MLSAMLSHSLHETTISFLSLHQTSVLFFVQEILSSFQPCSPHFINSLSISQDRVILLAIRFTFSRNLKSRPHASFFIHSLALLSQRCVVEFEADLIGALFSALNFNWIGTISHPFR